MVTSYHLIVQYIQVSENQGANTKQKISQKNTKWKIHLQYCIQTVNIIKFKILSIVRVLMNQKDRQSSQKRNYRQGQKIHQKKKKEEEEIANECV